MKQLPCRDGNIIGLTDGRCLDSRQVPHPLGETNVMRALQMHSSLVQRMSVDSVFSGHQGCVNALAWNSNGTLLLSGSDDTKVNLWEYGSCKLVHSIETGHTANIFCTKFMPETGDDVIISGAGDTEVRVHRLSRLMEDGAGFREPDALFRCHTRRVKKLAVEDGNPNVIWSASEDGTLRQHDLREGVLCGANDQDCRNILLDLRSGAKRSLSDMPRHCLSLKTCAISPTRPHHLLVGGSDAFARLYDRRMIPPPTSSSERSKPPPCVSYFCPAHLSDYNRGLHLTHVTFSPNGEEVLLSYSGEHVYLMDVANSLDSGVTYMASDVSKRTALAPILNGTKIDVPQIPLAPSRFNSNRNSVRLKECEELLAEGRRAMDEGNVIYTIDAASEVLDAGLHVIGLSLKHDCLCLRAAAFLKRAWKNDMHMAIRDSNEARTINPMSVAAHHSLAEALSQLGKNKEALDFAMRAHHLDPTDNSLSEHVTHLRSKMNAVEEARNNRNNENEAHAERRASRGRSLTDFFFRADTDHSDSSQDTRRTEREDSDIDDDVEMEMEIEMSVSGDDDRDREPGVTPSPSLNLRLRRRAESGRERRASSVTSTSEMTPETSVPQAETAVDMRQRYVGHCNTGTDIKQASFLGQRGEFVASGSDDGRWFIWQKRTGRLIKILVGDENVVNCVQSHPYDCAIATSGIDSTIKLWTPCAEVPSVISAGVAGPEPDPLRIMSENQQQMRRHREIGFLLIAEAWSIFARRFEYMQENLQFGADTEPNARRTFGIHWIL